MFQLGELDESRAIKKKRCATMGRPSSWIPRIVRRSPRTSGCVTCASSGTSDPHAHDAALKLIDTQRRGRIGQPICTCDGVRSCSRICNSPDEALPSYLRALETDAENDNNAGDAGKHLRRAQSVARTSDGHEKRVSLVREDVKRVEILRRAQGRDRQAARHQRSGALLHESCTPLIRRTAMRSTR